MMQRLGQKDADGEDEFWMPDDKVTFCIGCERKFTFWYRKHHCRVCGRIFCAACSSHVISGLTLGKANPDPVRACDACFEQKSQPHPSEAPEQLADVDVPPTPGGSEPEPAPGEDSGPAPFLRTTPLMQTSTTEVSLERGVSGEYDEDGEAKDFAEVSFDDEGLEVPPPSIHAPDAAALEQNAARLAEAAQARLASLVGQLLEDHGLGAEWTEQVVAMAQRAADTVSMPQDSPHFHIDFNRLVHVKRIAGGEIADGADPSVWDGKGCGFTDGVVARKNVADKKMAIQLANPKIMLLGCALDMGGPTRMVGLDALLEQEETHHNILVRKIKALGPDLVLVQKNAAGRVVTGLQEAGITIHIYPRTSLTVTN